MRIKASQYVAEFLADHGVTDVFSVTGGGAMHLNDAIGHCSRLHVTYNHHEQACAIAAEAYTRLTGRLAAVCVTSGPGGLNTLTGVMGGWTDSIPMFMISGQVKRETTIWSVPQLQLRQLGDQEFDIVHSVANCTKYAEMITDPDSVAYHLEKALFLCLSGRGGPVWLDIPLDIQGAILETDRLRHFDPLAEGEESVPIISGETAEEILKKIAAAKRPLILAGTGIRLADADNLLLEFIAKVKIPVVTAWNANDLVPADNPYYAGMPGTVGTRGGNFAVQNCDLLLSLGCRLNIRMISYNRFDFAKNAYKIIVDIDEKELKKPTIHADMPVCGDVKQLLKLMNGMKTVAEPVHKDWTDWCRKINAKYPAVLPAYHHSRAPINPYAFLGILFDCLNGNDTIVCGNGSACVMTFQACRIKAGQRMFTNSGCAAMGYGLPAALGAAVALQGGRVVCIDGDGSLMMNLQELETIFYNRLNIKLIVLNNNGYHSIRQTQTNLFKGQFVGVDSKSGVGFPDFKKIAEAFGIPYFRIDSEDIAQDTLDSFLSQSGPVFCEVRVDAKQNFEPKLSSKVLPDGKIVSPSLDDMYPFLSADDYKENHLTN